MRHSVRPGVPIALAAVAGLFVLFGLPRPAGAIDAAKPTPCAGLFASDPAGDAVIQSDQLGLEEEQPGTPNMDLTGLFLNYRAGADGKKSLTVNFVIKDLNRTIPDHASTTGGIYYYAHWAGEDGTPYFVKAINSGSGEPTFHHGEVVITPAFAFYATNGTVNGKFFEGPDGVVQVEIPESIGGAPGKTLGKLFGVVDTIEGDDDFTGINHHADSHIEEPNVAEPNGTDYAVAECPAPTGGGTTPTPSPSTTPAPTPGPTPPPSNQPAPAPGTAKLNLKIPATLGSARKASRTKKLAFKVTAAKAISNLQIQLRRANGKGAPLATARIASLRAGTSRITLKVAKKLKRGRYAIAAAGTVDGQTATTSRLVKIKK